MRKQHRKRTSFLGLSWLSILLVVGALSLVLGGVMFRPNSPRSTAMSNTVLLPEEGCDSQNNLHLCTFRMVTITPSPQPTSPPFPTGTNNGNNNGNNNGYNGGYNGGGNYSGGGGNGGSNPPPSNGGGNSGGGSNSGGGGSGGTGGGAPPL